MYKAETYELILDRILSRIPTNMDTRESSFLYNASAPIAVELQNMYLALDNILNITFFDTSDREGKLQRCKERGIDISQFDATSSVCIMKTTPASIEIPIGTRFNYEHVNFIVIEKVASGQYKMRCETLGTVGNVTGIVAPIDYVDGLESAEIISIFQWGEDEAEESVINEAYYSSLNSQAFGGNRADYLQKVKSIAGVGGVKVRSGSEWNGGGTVKIVFTTSSYTKPSDDFVSNIQTMIDPLQNQGEGYGIAPIGHTVTVAGVDETKCDITMKLTLQDNYILDDVLPDINAAIDEYFLSLNENWEKEANIVARISQLETRVLDVSGVIDVAGTALNGKESNLIVDSDSIVVRGEVNATT